MNRLNKVNYDGYNIRITAFLINIYYNIKCIKIIIYEISKSNINFIFHKCDRLINHKIKVIEIDEKQKLFFPHQM